MQCEDRAAKNYHRIPTRFRNDTVCRNKASPSALVILITTLVLFLGSAGLGRSPDGKAECDLVHKISKVVNQIERAVLHSTQQVSEEIAERVDRPTDRDDEAHSVKRSFHMLVHLLVASRHFASFADEDFLQDECPSRQADNEGQPSINETGLTDVA